MAMYHTLTAKDVPASVKKQYGAKGAAAYLKAANAACKAGESASAYRAAGMAAAKRAAKKGAK